MRADVAELLAAGVSARAISRDLGVPIRGVHAARRELGLPPCPPGPRPISVRDAFEARTCQTSDGHRVWCVEAWRGVRAFRHQGRKYSACQVAFLLHNGRSPVGRASPGCGRSDCVEPAHQDDADDRARLDADFSAVFGEAS